MASRRLAKFVAGFVAMTAIFAACGVAPIRSDGLALPPEPVRFAGPHGRPLAFGGGVCLVGSSHEHKYPPVPRAFFRESENGFVDARPFFRFWGMHRHLGRTCFQDGLHLHLDPGDEHGDELAFDETIEAWRARRAIDLE